MGDGRDLYAQDLLLGYAILAPSCYNTQPWKFASDDNEIKLFADKGRWLKVADGDKRELYLPTRLLVSSLIPVEFGTTFLLLRFSSKDFKRFSY